jgi:phosphoglycerate dehydrogenase-like enzyme
MSRFRVGLSADFMKADGTPAFPSFDLRRLDDDARIDWAYIPVTDGRMAAADMDGLDALILLAAHFDADSFPDNDRLSLIARFGVGYDTVDVDACNRNNVALVITPNGVRRPVAVAILTFILALSGKLLDKDRITRQGPDGWKHRADFMGHGLVGRTLGSIGAGNIGAEMFRLASPLGLKFIAHDPYADPDVVAELGIELVGLEDVFRSADYLTINCPLTEDTTGLVNAERLGLMKPSAHLINTARGPIVDQAALYEALTSRTIAGAGLDVFEQEPNEMDDPLFQLDNVIVTPHALCWTDQCFAGIGADDIAAVKAVMQGEQPVGIVNHAITDNPDWLEKLRAYGGAVSTQTDG